MEIQNKFAGEDTHFQVHNSLNCRGSLFDLSTPKIMGVLNLTPDSFHDGGRYLTEKESVTRASEMLNEGADILDIGGQSTRPGAARISSNEEWERVGNAVQTIVKEFPSAILSIDTFYADVAHKALSEGVSIVNDISAGSFDEKIIEVAALHNAPYILMHMQGNPETMQLKPVYSNVINEVLDFFVTKINRLKSAGISDIVLDPGFGFGKTTEHNYSLLANLSIFRMTGYPVMAGLSRKSMITKVLKVPNSEALNGTTVLNTIALLQGASILRVHDVKEAVETRTLITQYKRVQKS